jgi:hypothetical protein
MKLILEIKEKVVELVSQKGKSLVLCLILFRKLK